jgi:hypothetical protein
MDAATGINVGHPSGQMNENGTPSVNDDDTSYTRKPKDKGETGQDENQGSYASQGQPPPKTRRVGGSEILNTKIFRFVDKNIPYAGKLLRELLTLVKKPPMKQIAIVASLALCVGVLLSLLPLKVINYLHGTHWTKIFPVVMAFPPVRIAIDSIYMFLVRKIKLVYLVLKLAVVVAIFPFLLLYTAFANLSRVRVMVIMCMAQPIISKLLTIALDFILEVINDLKSDDVNQTTSMVKGNGAAKFVLWITSISFVVFILFAIYINEKEPVLYMFCFDQLHIRSVVSVIVAVAIYVQLSLIVYIDATRAGLAREQIRAASRKQFARKAQQLTIMTNLACIATLYLAMSMNPGYFARAMLLDPRAIAIE